MPVETSGRHSNAAMKFVAGALALAAILFLFVEFGIRQPSEADQSMAEEAAEASVPQDVEWSADLGQNQGMTVGEVETMQAASDAKSDAEAAAEDAEAAARAAAQAVDEAGDTDGDAIESQAGDTMEQ